MSSYAASCGSWATALLIAAKTELETLGAIESDERSETVTTDAVTPDIERSDNDMTVVGRAAALVVAMLD